MMTVASSPEMSGINIATGCTTGFTLYFLFAFFRDLQEKTINGGIHFFGCSNTVFYPELSKLFRIAIYQCKDLLNSFRLSG